MRDAGNVDEGVARNVMRVLRCFGHGEHGGEAHVGAFHDFAPLGLCFLFDDDLQLGFKGGPLRWIHLFGECWVVGEASLFEEQCIELRFDAADGNVFVVLALEDVVEVCAGVEQVGAGGVFVEHADAFHGPEHAHEGGRAVDHCGVDDLALAALLCFEQCADNAECEEHAAAAEVAHHVERWNGCFACAGEVCECAGKCDVVDVVAGEWCVGAVLAPASHATENNFGVALCALGWADA